MSTAKGTPFETLIVRTLNAAGFRTERRAKQGAKDRGDITGLHGIVIECKRHKTARLSEWVREAEAEAWHDDDWLPVVAHKRWGYGQGEDQYVTMTVASFIDILKRLDTP